MDEFQEKREKLTHKTFLMMFHILWVFGLPAIGAYFGGRWLDNSYNMRPYGSLIATVIALTISWIAIYKMYRWIVGEYKKIKQDEEIENSSKKEEGK